MVAFVAGNQVVCPWIRYSTKESEASLVVQVTVAADEVMPLEATPEIVGGVVSGGASVVKIGSGLGAQVVGFPEGSFEVTRYS